MKHELEPPYPNETEQHKILRICQNAWYRAWNVRSQETRAAREKLNNSSAVKEYLKAIAPARKKCDEAIARADEREKRAFKRMFETARKGGRG